ncbi:hypothetical protein ACX1H4_03160 [Yersinia enterocolitica]|uniref:hypothetical protein n=1 Tax=Yersinia enterocolitica TaxID=630 RepID=UPI002AC3BECA|nr:hypothetical protein [Yersinia enterocolitica]HEN3443684.1 hypothetical protein [Yersinia enterocolitica]
MSEQKSNVDADLDELGKLLGTQALACAVINAGFRKVRTGPVVLLPAYISRITLYSQGWDDALDEVILAIRDAGLPEAIIRKGDVA